MPSREVRVAIIGDPSSLQRALRTSEAGVNRFSSRMQAFGSAMTRFGTRASLGLTLPLVAFGRMAAQELSASETALAQTQAVIESTGQAAGKSVQDIVDLSSALSEMSSVDDEEIQNMANTLLTFRGIAGDTFDEVAEATLNMSIALDRDLRSSAVMVGKALNDPVAGMSALGRAGVQFNDEFRDTGYTMREAIEWMVEMGDTAGAQQVILSELNQEFGGSARALGETLTGRLQRAKNRFEELSAEVLADLIPVFETLAGVVDRLGDAFDGLTPKQQQFVAFGLLALAVMGPLATVVGGLSTALGAVAGVLGVVGGAVAALIVALGALAASLMYARQNWAAVTAGLGSFLSLARNIPGVGAVVSVVTGIVNIHTGAWRALIGVVRSAVGVFASIANITLEGTIGTVNALASAVRGLLGAISSVADAFSRLPSVGGLTGGDILQDAGISGGNSFIPRPAGGKQAAGQSFPMAEEIGRAMARELQRRPALVQPVGGM